MQKICKKGTHGSHLSVRTIFTNGSATNARPIIIGKIINVLVVMERRTIPFIRSLLSCMDEYAGSITD